MIQAWSLIAALDYKYYILCTTNDTGWSLVAVLNLINILDAHNFIVITYK